MAKWAVKFRNRGNRWKCRSSTERAFTSELGRARYEETRCKKDKPRNQDKRLKPDKKNRSFNSLRDAFAGHRSENTKVASVEAYKIIIRGKNITSKDMKIIRFPTLTEWKAIRDRKNGNKKRLKVKKQLSFDEWRKVNAKRLKGDRDPRNWRRP